MRNHHLGPGIAEERAMIDQSARHEGRRLGETARRTTRFHAECGGYGLLFHRNLCGYQCTMTTPEQATRFDCLHELQSAMRRHQAPPGSQVIAS